MAAASLGRMVFPGYSDWVCLGLILLPALPPLHPFTRHFQVPGTKGFSRLECSEAIPRTCLVRLSAPAERRQGIAQLGPCHHVPRVAPQLPRGSSHTPSLCAALTPTSSFTALLGAISNCLWLLHMVPQGRNSTASFQGQGLERRCAAKPGRVT